MPMNDAPSSARPAKLALLLQSLVGGGVERVMLHLAEAFRAGGHPVDLVLCRKEGAYLDDVPAGVRVVTLQAQRGLAARLQLVRLDPGGLAALARPALLTRRPAPAQLYVADLARYLDEVRPAALLAAKTRINLLALWARRASRAATRIVVAEHTQLSPTVRRSRKWRWRYIGPLIARTYPKADGVVAVSNGVGEDLSLTTGFPRERITTIYNPVVGPGLEKQAAEAAPHHWLAEAGGSPVIVGAGRLVPQKNFPLLLRAFAKLRAQRPVRLLILGEGKERPSLEALAVQLGIQEDVALPGFAANPYAALARAALFVLSSDWEGLPTVLIEALACGCPVVSTDCPSGPAEILEGGRYGELVRAGDADALASAMGRSLLKGHSAELLRRRGAEFSVERSAQRYLDILLSPATRI